MTAIGLHTQGIREDPFATLSRIRLQREVGWLQWSRRCHSLLPGEHQASNPRVLASFTTKGAVITFFVEGPACPCAKGWAWRSWQRGTKVVAGEQRAETSKLVSDQSRVPTRQTLYMVILVAGDFVERFFIKMKGPIWGPHHDCLWPSPISNKLIHGRWVGLSWNPWIIGWEGGWNEFHVYDINH